MGNKRGSRNALDRCSNPKTLDEVINNPSHFPTLRRRFQSLNLMFCSTRKRSWSSAAPWNRSNRAYLAPSSSTCRAPCKPPSPQRNARFNFNSSNYNNNSNNNSSSSSSNNNSNNNNNNI